MWRIKSIDIYGLLESFDLHWDLDPKVNILGGGNGTGKSTLLKAIYIQFNTQKNNDRIIVHSEAVFGSIHSELKNGFQVNAEKSVKILNTTSTKDGQFNNLITEEEITFNITSQIPEDFSEKSHNGALVVYLNSMEANLRSMSDTLSKSWMRERPGTSMLDLLIEQRLNMRNALFSDLMSKAIDKADDLEMKRVQELFGKFSKTLKEFMTDYEIENMSALIFSRKGHPNKTIPFFQLSGGEKQLIYLLLSVANTMGRPTILLLDEADMGMHVDWKRMLLRQLLAINPNMQIIAATHSPALIDGWRDKVKEINQLHVNTSSDLNR